MGPQRIGLYGGTFNPVHLAHLQVARTAQRSLDLDRVLFIPAGLPPLKGNAELADASHRLEMLRLALADEPEFDICDFEIKRHGKSFTLDTVRHLRQQHPDDELFFILGDDCAAKLNQWKGIDELARLVTFACAPRLGTVQPVVTPPVRTIEMPRVALSSTLIRQNLAAGMPVADWVPPAVAFHIERHRLYRAADSGVSVR
jgi:nicotinate-nucleotide adenylyltransferase